MILLQWFQRHAMGEKVNTLDASVRDLESSKKRGEAHALRNWLQPDHVTSDFLIAQIYLCLTHFDLPGWRSTPWRGTSRAVWAESAREWVYGDSNQWQMIKLARAASAIFSA
jgi:hypothetical protein